MSYATRRCSFLLRLDHALDEVLEVPFLGRTSGRAWRLIAIAPGWRPREQMALSSRGAAPA